MNVYVEYAVVDNFVMDYLLLKLAALGGGVKSSVKKRVLGALFGTVVAVYLPLFNADNLTLIVIKAVTAALMVYFSCECGGVRAYLARLAIFLCFTALFGGLLFGICTALGYDYDFFTNSVSGDFLLAPAVVGGVLVYGVCYYFCKLFLKRKIVEPFLRSCIIKSCGQTVRAVGFIDSGNSLTASDLCGVCVADKTLADYLLKSRTVCGKCEKTFFQTAAGGSVMCVYTVDELTVINGKKQNIIYKAKIGVPDCPIGFGGEYSLLLPASYAFSDSGTNDEK